jgi:Arc/MetJ-type ribon-helix-helix transcriptional regulator
MLKCYGTYNLATGELKMKTIAIELPDRLTAEVDTLVQDGWFADEAEVVRAALWEFVRRNRFALAEHYQRADIAWALEQSRQRRAGTPYGA